MPAEQFPQRGVVAAANASDQLVVIHRISIAPGRRSVRERSAILQTTSD
jgi:hypothetical protein